MHPQLPLALLQWGPGAQVVTQLLQKPPLIPHVLSAVPERHVPV